MPLIFKYEVFIFSLKIVNYHKGTRLANKIFPIKIILKKFFKMLVDVL